MKRKIWKDRTCSHGNKAEWRVTYDIIHCNEPGCWVESLRRLGLAASPELKDKRTGWLIVSSDEARLRGLLWAMHPCVGKYGDDGELQCPCGCDFRRDSVEEIERKTVEMNLRKLAAAPEEPNGRGEDGPAQPEEKQP